MKQTYNVLIIDDHPIIIDTFKNALLFVEKELEGIEFRIDEAKCCQSAFEKIKIALEKKNLDIIYLDIQLPPSNKYKLYSGEDLGVVIRKISPKSKVIICTSSNDNFRLNTIFKKIKPESYLIKSDIVFNDFIMAIKKVLSNESFYSQTIIDLMKQRLTDTISLDTNDMLLLYEMSNGAKMHELLQIIPLTKSGIEKKKRLLKDKFKLKNGSDRDLVLAAKTKGFI